MVNKTTGIPRVITIFSAPNYCDVRPRPNAHRGREGGTGRRERQGKTRRRISAMGASLALDCLPRLSSFFIVPSCSVSPLFVSPFSSPSLLAPHRCTRTRPRVSSSTTMSSTSSSSSTHRTRTICPTSCMSSHGRCPSSRRKVRAAVRWLCAPILVNSYMCTTPIRAVPVLPSNVVFCPDVCVCVLISIGF